MSDRKRSAESSGGDPELPAQSNKRSRRTRSASLLDVSSDLRVKMFAYLNKDDGLPNVAMTCKALNQDSRHNSLDQKRVAVIRWLQPKDIWVSIQRLRKAQKNGLLAERFTSLKLIDRVVKYSIPRKTARKIDNVSRRLELSVTGLEVDSVESNYSYLFRVLPNLERAVIRIQGQGFWRDYEYDYSCLDGIHQGCPMLQVLHLPFSGVPLFLTSWGGLPIPGLTHLQELHLDRHRVDGNFLRNIRRSESIRRLSLLETENFATTTPGPIPQDRLMSLVRGMPHLEWFRSHLTDNNISLLRDEFPNITFLNT